MLFHRGTHASFKEGFREGYSTAMVLIVIVDNIVWVAKVDV